VHSTLTNSKSINHFQMTNFVPPPRDKRKRGGGDDDDETIAAAADDDDADLSKVSGQENFEK